MTLVEHLTHGPHHWHWHLPHGRVAEIVVACAVAANLTVAVSAVVRWESEAASAAPAAPGAAAPAVTAPGITPYQTGQVRVGLNAEPSRATALRAARYVVTLICPGLSPASLEGVRADAGYERVNYTIWVQQAQPQPRRFALVLYWQDQAYDYVVTSGAGCDRNFGS